ncbi:MAG: phosphoribosylformimino-5-aminoimidazole carboxamide ribotide isomerase [Bacillota bacterium]|jgi:phosphoribosylformimino-5-aminoimidazole carboxamide ribotide isomerase|nr:phosphoribosylformimino-5-aminoimidazole carboxamide ribotide isomerase [Bacillota bacterium]MDK2882697.1 phosphoribosylformimino-5-aminoimidazole carboxamide ribotide isomerase [Bacillota bacterium]
MLVIPAVDLRDGACVRLYQGRFEAEVYRGDPLLAAGRWAAEGAGRLHVVDLDGAREGRPRNIAVLAEMAAAYPVEIQFGGGLRRLEDLARARAAGARRLILGTAAVRDPDLVRGAVQLYGEAILVSLDVLDGYVRTCGWEEGSRVQAVTLAKELAALGVQGFIYTDTSRDGTLSGPDLDGACAVAQAAGRPVLVAGGFGRPEDVEKAAAREGEGIAGVILGRALYTGAITLPAALRICEGRETHAR